MRRLLSLPERGSSLIEAVVIGSFVFIVIAAAVSATIEVSRVGGDATAAARVSGVHAARHAGPEAAESMVSRLFVDADASTGEGAIHVVVSDRVRLPHPDGLRSLDVFGVVDIPLAPFRSDRG